MYNNVNVAPSMGSNMPFPYENVAPMMGANMPFPHENVAPMMGANMPFPHENIAPVMGANMPFPHENIAPVMGANMPFQPELSCGYAEAPAYENCYPSRGCGSFVLIVVLFILLIIVGSCIFIFKEIRTANSKFLLRKLLYINRSFFKLVISTTKTKSKNFFHNYGNLKVL